MRKCLVAVVVAAMLVGCGNLPFSKSDQGMVIGGVLGGMGGSTLGSGSGSLLGAVVGAFIGGYIGREAGRYMDRADRMMHDHAVVDAIDHDRDSAWSNPRTGHRGRAEVGRYYHGANGYCREYKETVWVGGRKFISPPHTACQRPGGPWQIVN